MMAMTLFRLPEDIMILLYRNNKKVEKKNPTQTEIVLVVRQCDTGAKNVV
jgi:hypothetical protein